MRNPRRKSGLLLAGVLLVLTYLLYVHNSLAFAEDDDPPALYLPLVMRSLSIQLDTPIWADDTAPAQFSQTLREYDVYPLGTLGPVRI